MLKNHNVSNVLVTGGCGFIGSNFIFKSCEKFPEIHFTNLDNLSYAVSSKTQSELTKFKNYSFIQLDICDKDLLQNLFEKNSFDLVVHFAAESHVDNSIEDPSQFINTNILGTFNLLSSICNTDSRKKTQTLFHHISTDEIFGSLDMNDAAFTELSNLSPSSPYSASKASSDMLVEAWGKTYGLKFLITNCSNNFGPRQYIEKLIPKVIIHGFNKKKIPVYGTGANVRDWLHVDDHIGAIHSLYSSGMFLNERFNIGGGIEISNLNLIKHILEIMESKDILSKPNDLIEFVGDRKGHDFRYAINSKKLKDFTGWEPSVSFTNNMTDTIDWYIKNYDWWEY